VVTADRRSLAALLLRWQAGDLGAWQMIEEAEGAEDLLFGDMAVVPEIPKEDPQSISVAVLELLSAAHHQQLLPADVPAVLEFLETQPGGELEAWARFEQYWEAVDWQARESAVQELYFEPGRPGE
jgi:hypothetical protein